MRIDKDLIHDLHNYNINISTREIFLHNSFNSDDNENPGVEYKMANTFIKNIRVLEKKSLDPITIHMNSIGGEWSDGMAIYDSISLCKSHVTVIVYGQAESMSSLILQAADERLMMPSSYFMCHFGSSYIGGDFQNAHNWMEQDKKFMHVMIDIYAKRCVDGQFFKDKFNKKPTENQVKQFLMRKFKSGDWYLSAEEAVYHGFADKVIASW